MGAGRRGHFVLRDEIRHDPLIGDFKSPLYTKDGSGETAFRYPNDVPQGHWGGETKPTHMSRVLLRRNAPRIECCRRAAVACGRPLSLRDFLVALRDQRLGFLDENRSCSCNYASKLLLNTARSAVIWIGKAGWNLWTGEKLRSTRRPRASVRSKHCSRTMA